MELVGRDDALSDLERKLSAHEATGATISGARAGLQGMGGVGKTALATVLAHRLKDRYPDAQLFLNLRGADPEHRPPVTSIEAMQSVIHSFQPEARLPDTLDALMPIYHSVLANGGHMLLLLDNAADAAQVRPLLPPPNCLLLVTSRQQFALPGLETRNLDCLAPEKSRELLLKLAPRLDGHADEAAKLCGHLPLALEVFAGVVNDKRLFPVPELIDRLRTRQDKLAPVEAAFQVSYDLLSAGLRRRWTLLAVFPTSFDLHAVAAMLGDSVDSARDAMQELVNASLVEWNETNGRFRLHDLVRQFCDDRLPSSDRTGGHFRHASHYRDVAAEAGKLYLKGGENVLRGLELFDRERAHLETAFAWLQSRRDRESAAVLVSLVGAVAYTGNLRFNSRQLILWLGVQLEAARIAKDRKAEDAALGNLGVAYAELGDARKAIEFHEQSLIIDREIGDRRGEGIALGNLGAAYAILGDARKAIEFFEQALTIACEIGDRRDQGNALGNLGIAYKNLGDARKAIEFFEKHLVIAREIGDRRSEGNALGNLGIAYAILGDPRKAIEFYEQALTIACKIGDRHGEGNSLGNLGIAYAELGDARKAIEFHEQSLIIDREIGDRRGEGATLGNLGNAYKNLGDARKAIEFFEQHLVIAREIGDRRSESNALGNLGIAHFSLGDARKAIEFYEQQASIAREIGDRRGEGITLWNSALALDKLGDRAHAIARAEAALQIFETIEDPNAAKVRAKLAAWRG